MAKGPPRRGAASPLTRCPEPLVADGCERMLALVSVVVPTDDAVIAEADGDAGRMTPPRSDTRAAHTPQLRREGTTLAGGLGPWALAGRRGNAGMASDDDRAGTRAREKHLLRAPSSNFDCDHDGDAGAGTRDQGLCARGLCARRVSDVCL